MLSRAELEALPLDNNLKEDVGKGKVRIITSWGDVGKGKVMIIILKKMLGREG